MTKPDMLTTRPQVSEPRLPHLQHIPRVHFAHLPTPLERAPRLSAALGGPTVWIKRDDCTGLAGGGNKTRKLEFLLAEARAKGADTIVTFGALQSNHARQTAAACAKLGLRCELILSRRVRYTNDEYEHGGNLLLDDLLGATVHLVEPEASTTTWQQRRGELRAAGRVAYVVPTGGSSATGALGYVVCADEILAQSTAAGFRPTAIVHASSSGGTQAGLVAGCARSAGMHNATAIPVIGVNTYAVDAAQQRTQITELTNEVLARLQLGPVQPDAIQVEQGYLGADYGMPTQAMVEAVRIAAETEALLLDPVYSGKAMAGMIGMIRAGRFSAADHIVFVHTGGAVALSPYRPEFISTPVPVAGAPSHG